MTAPIYTPQRNKGGVNDFIVRQRTDAGMRMISSRGLNLRESFRVLREGGILIFLQDLDARKEGAFVPFLGLPARTATGIVKMYRKFGAPVVPAVAVRDTDGIHHTIHIQEMLSDLRDEDGNPFGMNMEKSLKICNNILSKWVMKYAEQWMWLLDKWESALRP
jgi:KDO2-lipid IV(A) lauroyltransferase